MHLVLPSKLGVTATSTAPMASKTTAPMKRKEGSGQVCPFPSSDGGGALRRMRWGRRRRGEEGADATTQGAEEGGRGGRARSSEGRGAQGPLFGAWSVPWFRRQNTQGA
jgi:hypothetical protein